MKIQSILIYLFFITIFWSNVACVVDGLLQEVINVYILSLNITACMAIIVLGSVLAVKSKSI